MNRGLADVRRRRQGDRGRIAKAAFKGLLFLGGLAVVGIYGYLVGRGLSEEERASLETEVTRLSGELAVMTPARAAQEEKLHELELALDAANTRYKRDVPTTAEAEILRQARRRMDAGIPAPRIASIVAAAPAEERCDTAVETKRIAISITDAPNQAGLGRFANGGIIVAGTGRSARDDAGRVQAWFDPSAPVTLKFSRPGGQTSEATGTLPLYHTVVLGDRAWRFSAVPGARSFVELTADRCVYP
jgi:hypothetical protein